MTGARGGGTIFRQSCLMNYENSYSFNFAADTFERAPQQETRYACSDSDKASVKKYFAETDENNKVLSDIYRARNTGEHRPLSFCRHGRVVSLPMPAFPAIARRDRLRGVIRVEAIADEKGNIFFAKAISGPSIFRNSAVKAACSSKFKPIAFEGKTLKFQWNIIYNFIQ